ncbi:site-2 protease family protein [Lentibacter sp. XHP0401]|jgi:stage IV sporulation protein FB|uniref:site-2 protease family protein n=1 Tax=Lentibacter sp. XHP0401 TaxID=2984334 RepID=UPI0021E956A0|nr:site-2 protease family protein [Lentibacter sp. XHP0401]MCV2894389.1 site-2 protease family protein [Lentibacter sp. XHP0401]
MFQTGPTLFSFRGLFGVQVDVSQSLVMLAGLLLFLSGLSNFIWVAVLVAMLLTSIYLHELGHAWGCLVQGVPVRRIVLHGGGGFCEHARSASRQQQELIIAMGPLVNLALWALASLGSWWIFSGPSMGLDMIGGYLSLFARLNLALFIFNLLPVQPLDGGKLLQLGLLRFFPQNVAMRTAGAIGLVFAVLWWPALIYVYFTFGWLLLFAPPIMLHWHMARGEYRV